MFGLDFFYARQNSIRDGKKDDGIDTGGEDSAENEADLRNKRYVDIIKSLLSYANKKTVFRFGEYIETLPSDVLNEQLRLKALPDVMLKLYGMGEIDVAGWKTENQSVIVPVGEFDLSYCLSELDEELVQMRTILIYKIDEVISFSDETGSSISMNDFKIEVVK